mmetsp:Transcript_75046/g.219864  ORF Transcript_75046/g.219864 Transcript_75046/m.219864 type:complete len:365 (-) Transcript_75046:74-1168(-)
MKARPAMPRPQTTYGLRSETHRVELVGVVCGDVDAGTVDGDPGEDLVHDNGGVLQTHPTAARVDLPYVQDRVLAHRGHLAKLLLRAHPRDPPCVRRELHLQLPRKSIVQADGPGAVRHEQPRAHREDPHRRLAFQPSLHLAIGARSRGLPDAQLAVAVGGVDLLRGRTETDIRNLRGGAVWRGFWQGQEGVGGCSVHKHQRALRRADDNVLQGWHHAGGRVALLDVGRLRCVCEWRIAEHRRGILVVDLRAVRGGDAQHGAGRELEVADGRDLGSLRPGLALASRQGEHHQLPAANIHGVVDACEPAVARDGEVVVDQGGGCDKVSHLLEEELRASGGEHSPGKRCRATMLGTMSAVWVKRGRS